MIIGVFQSKNVFTTANWGCTIVGIHAYANYVGRPFLIFLDRMKHMCSQWWLQLREYPVKFGFRIVDLFIDLTKSARGQPGLPSEIPNAQESFQGMPDESGALQFAQMDEVFNYLRRGKHLQIPDSWKNLIPKPKWNLTEQSEYHPQGVGYTLWPIYFPTFGVMTAIPSIYVYPRIPENGPP